MLELHDPLRVRTVEFAARTWRLTADYDAATARAYEIQQEGRGSLAIPGFTLPDVLLDKARITMLEPYQPGKTPVLFVHGLLADPFIFNDMIIALQKTPGFVDHFQIWVYSYPTGVPWFRTAAILRDQIRRDLDDVRPRRGRPRGPEHGAGGIQHGGAALPAPGLVERRRALEPGVEPSRWKA